jgi:hypothetical protein
VAPGALGGAESTACSGNVEYAIRNLQSAICNPQSAICKLFCGQSEQSRPSDRHMHNAVTIRTLACAVSAPFPLGLGEEWDLLT